jgi:chemotaxis protein methyltransferase CheR
MIPVCEASPSAVLSPGTFAKFCQFITTELGIKMSENKVPMLQSRLLQRLRKLGLGSLDAYRAYLFDSPQGEEELVHFINAITTNKTDFFRESRHFSYLTQTALSNLAPKAGAGLTRPWRLNLWCAGCSSGEEPYTLAMVLAEYGVHQSAFDYSILATDISTRVLSHAQLGIYDEERIGPIPAALRQKYLLRSKDRARALVRVVPELRSKLSFQRLNFMAAHYGLKETFDVIFFRNVMIYFDKPTQEAVIHKLCRHLAPGGYMFVGHSESLAGLSLPVVCVGSAVYRKPM